MNIKTILFDADGVAIKVRDQFFSERLAEKQGMDVSLILPFFKNEMRQAFVNKADIKESLEKYLPTWNWTGSVDQFLEHWFSEESPRDDEVLNYINELRGAGIKCYLATDREKRWAEYLVNVTNLKDNFDGFLFSHDIGYTKDEPGFFEEVSRRLELNPSEIQYWDDDQENVDVAKEIGIDARYYTNLENLKEETNFLID